MGLGSFIKKLIETDTIWGVRSKKLTGINDSFNKIAGNNIVFDNASGTITIPTVTTIPSWITSEKYFRAYSGDYKVCEDPAITYTVIPATNEFQLFRVGSAAIVGGDLVITCDPLTSTPEDLVMAVGKIDGRIAMTHNNPDLSRLTARGGTMYNVEANITTGLEDASGISQADVPHYHLKAEASFRSHYNTQDGIGDARVLNFPSYTNCFPSTSNLAIFGAGGWNNNTSHPSTSTQTSGSVVTWENDNECTDMQGGEIRVTVEYFDNTNAFQTEVLSLFLNGTLDNQTLSLNGITILVRDLILDGVKIAGFIQTTVNYLLLPNFSEGGRVSRMETEHITPVLGTFNFDYIDGVFVDVGNTPPIQAGVPTVTIGVPDVAVTSFLSGVEYYANGTEIRIQNSFTELWSTAFSGTPVRVTNSLANIPTDNMAFNDPELIKPNAFPLDDDPASIDVLQTLSGTSTCAGSLTVGTRAEDCWGNSTTQNTTLSNTNISNLVSSSSNNLEDFVGESFRIQPTSDNTVVPVANWDSTASLPTYVGGEHAQQVPCVGACPGALVYPTQDYTLFDPPGPNYSVVADGIVWHYRHYSNSVGLATHTSGVVRVDLCSGTLSEADLNADNIIIEIMLANTNATNRTSWLKLNRVFNNATFNPNNPGTFTDDQELGCRTMTDELAVPTFAPEFGFTLGSSFFNRYTETSSGLGVMVRVGIPLGSVLEVNTVQLVGW